MSILIVTGLIIAVLVVLFLVAALFAKKEYTIERAITINQFKPEVFNYIRFLKNQDHYSKWVMTDPAMKKEFRGTDGTIGFVYAWDGNKKAGKGEQEIKQINEGKLDLEIRFMRPFEGRADVYMATKHIPGGHSHQTRVTWGMKGRSKYPMNLMTAMMGKMLGKDLETSLSNLKNILEKQPATRHELN